MGNNRQKMKFKPSPELMKKILDHQEIKKFNRALAKYKGMGFSLEEATKRALGDIDPNVDWRSQVSLLLKRYEDEREKKREESRTARHDPGSRGRSFRKKSKDLSFVKGIPSTPYRALPRVGDVTAGGRHPRAVRAGAFDLGSPAHPLHPLSAITGWMGNEIGKEWESAKARYGNLGRDVVDALVDPARAHRFGGGDPNMFRDEPDRDRIDTLTVPLTDEEYFEKNRDRMYGSTQDRIDWLNSLTDSDIAKGYHRPKELEERVKAERQKRRREERLRGMLGRADPFDVVQSPLWAVSPQDKRRHIAEQQEKHREAMESSPAFMATRGGIYPHKNYQQRYLDPRAVRDFEDIQGDKLRPPMDTYIHRRIRESSLDAAKKARLNAAHPLYLGSSMLRPIGLIDQDARNKEIDYNLRRAEIMHNRAIRDFKEGRYGSNPLDPVVPWHEKMTPHERAQAQRGADLVGRRQVEKYLEESRKFQEEQQKLPPLERDLPYDHPHLQGLKEPWTHRTTRKVPEYAMEYLTGLGRYTQPPASVGGWRLR